ncbi:MAG: DUF3431 domain-containing protein [Kiritimatiellae bacterium]|nr:DUF3431 domain-containing protein [Kiritimatiellia bacterium]MDW8457936.1 DUF3431 domain-containing protein [Verrucomicrobiota bacterium]
MTLELVVARHREDLSWLRRVPRDIRIFVYDKSGAAAPGAIALPNIGREAHTYLFHIATRYDALADVTVFVQGRPFDHAPDLHKRLRALSSGQESVADFRWLGFLVDEDDETGSRLFQTWSKNTERRPLNMAEFWRLVFGSEPMPDRFVFFGGAQFAVTREIAHRRPRKFYEAALQIAGSFPDAAHCFERVWDRMFGVDGIPESIRGRPLPYYLKPIRRLGGAPAH